MLHREIPFLRICVPLCCGIVTGLYFKPGTNFITASAIIVLILFVSDILYKRYTGSTFFGFIVSLSLYLSGLFLYTLEKSSLSVLKEEPSVIYCTVSDYPAEKSNSMMLTLKLHQKIKNSGAEHLKGSLIAYHRKDEQVESLIPGDRLLLRCTPIEITNRGNPYEFDYRFYMENLGTKYYAFTNRNSILLHDVNSPRNLRHKALIVRRKIIEMYHNRGVSDDMLPIVSALTLGEKSKIDREQKENFIQAGVMHIMAVSGLHAVILSMFVLNLLFFLKRRFNVLRIIIAIIFLWLFAFVTGLTPSVLRATIMFSFLQAGNLMHRKPNGINSVLASAFVLILIRPSVIFDAGFLLSYAAVIFIIAFYMDFYLLLSPKSKPGNWLWQSASVTMVAQTGTLPLTIMLFNRFPVWFIVTNIVIVPLSSLAIILGCLIPLLYPIRMISGTIGFLLDRLTGLTVMLTEKAAHLPFSGITGIGMTVSGCIILFLFLFAMMHYISSKRRRDLRLILFFLLIMVLVNGVTAMNTKTSNELIVYNINSSCTVGIRKGKLLNIYSDTLLMDPEINRHRSAAGLRVKYHKLEAGTHLIKAGNTWIMISVGSCSDPGNNLHPEILIVSAVKGNLPETLLQSPEKIIVASGSPSFSFHKEWVQKIHYIRKSGAYICKL